MEEPDQADFPQESSDPGTPHAQQACSARPVSQPGFPLTTVWAFCHSLRLQEEC